jgi:hypothetical protein
MSTVHITRRIVSARSRDAVVAGYYLLTILTGVLVMFVRGAALDLIAGVFYIAVTAVLYVMSGAANGGKER